MPIVAHTGNLDDNLNLMSEATEKLLEQSSAARREQRFAEARRDLVEAVALCRADGDAGQLAGAVTRLGAIERDMGNRDAALRHYGEALALYRLEGDALRVAHTVRHLGDIHREISRFDLAEPCYLEALDIYRSHLEAPVLDLGNTVRGFALLKGEVGDRAAARALWAEARDLYEVVGVTAGIEESSRRLAALETPPATDLKASEATPYSLWHLRTELESGMPRRFH